ncbi:MAG: DUF362 domain-containing protein [bacterium]|nr:DUF362 domain-containing protein [bacterium]
MSQRNWTRRSWLATAAGIPLAHRSAEARAAPTAPVAVAKCATYGRELLPAMRRMFDQLGGLERLVAGKTVAVKLNMTGGATRRLAHEPAEISYWTHPNVAGTFLHLLGRAGAARIRVIESFATGTNPLEEEMLVAGWEPNDFLNAASNVETENTGHIGYAKQYARMMVPNGGYIYPGFDFNHSYRDCDVFVSVAKLKEHVTAGVTLTMKNLFGIAPATIYGSGAGIDEPALIPRGGRQMFHYGGRQPSRSAPQENDFRSSREPGYRVPRIIADLVAARPIDIAIIDGIETMTAGEGPWNQRGLDRRITRISPGLLIAGTNPVTTDAVGAACMGFDPMAGRGTPPFEGRDNHLQLAEQHGIGTRDLNHIEVIGTPIAEARFPFRDY